MRYAVFLIKRVLHFVDGLLESHSLPPNALMKLAPTLPSSSEGRDHLQHVGVVEVEHALVAILVQQRVEHGAGLAGRIW